MIQARPFRQLAALAISLAVIVSVSVMVPHEAFAADTISQKVGVPLKAAQDLIKEHKYREALAKVDEAEKVGSLTEYESYVIAQMRGAAAAGAGDAAAAIHGFEPVVENSRTPPAQKLQLTQAIGQWYYSLKNYSKSAEWLNKYKQMGGNDPQTETVLAQSYYLSGDYGKASTELAGMLKADEAAGRTPPQQQLELYASSAHQQGNQDAYIGALESLVRFYPKPDYWQDLIQRVAAKPGFADRLSLDLYRVHIATNTMKGASDYLEAAQLALQAGYPGEAKSIVDKGFQAKVLGTGDATEQDRHNRLRQLVEKQVADDQKALPASEKDANAAPNGDALVNTGYDYVAYGQNAKGIQLMEQGIAKGSLKHADDAQLHLAVAYYNSGQKAKALETLKLVKGSDGTSDLAHLWTLAAKSGG